MRTKLCFSVVCAAMILASPAMAQVSPIPIPETGQFGGPVVQAPGVVGGMDSSAGFVPPIPLDGQVFVDGGPHQGPIYVDEAPIPLFTRVKYVDKHEKHPCAVTKIIKVNNPCKGRKDCCLPDCVYIEVCAPPCECEEEIRCRRRGDRLSYNYGKYGFDVRVKNGFIVVDYQRKGRFGF